MVSGPDNPISAQISWVYTPELAASASFYAALPGFECVRDEGAARIFRVAQGAHIGVCEAFADRVVEPKGSMISLVVDDVEACYRAIRSAGIETDGPPRRLARFGITSFFLRDPNGYVLEFQQFL